MRALLNRVVLRVASIVILAVLAAPSASGQAQAPPRKTTSESARDLSLGTWVMNREKSTYRPGPAPLAITRTYEPHPDGVKVTIETVTERGKSVVEFIAEYDSMEYPVRGSPDIDALSLTAVDTYTAEIILKHAGRDIGFARRVIARDGKTMTMTFSSEAIRNVTVYEKKEPAP
jgi:hypothetical protein